MEDSLIKNDLLVVLVLYEKGLLESVAYKSLTAIGDFTFLVYDNSPRPHYVPRKATLTYRHDPLNPGVSKAYNIGAELAIKKNKKWMLLADQDTVFPPTLFSDYSSAIENNSQMNVFAPTLYDSKGIVSPFQLRWGKGRRIKEIKPGMYSFGKFKIINSGMLISIAAFTKVGGYDERFPLDYSDIRFSDRLCMNDPDFVLIPSRCQHNLSATNEGRNVFAEMDRFKSFCKAVRLYKEVSIQFVSPAWVILPRAIKLCMRIKDFGFLKIAWQND